MPAASSSRKATSKFTLLAMAPLAPLLESLICLPSGLTNNESYKLPLTLALKLTVQPANPFLPMNNAAASPALPLTWPPLINTQGCNISQK